MKSSERLAFMQAQFTPASGADRFAYTKADTKAEECRNAMFDGSPCASVLHVSFSLKQSFFFFFPPPMILCCSLTAWLQPGPLTYIQLLMSDCNQSHLPLFAERCLTWLGLPLECSRPTDLSVITFCSWLTDKLCRRVVISVRLFSKAATRFALLEKMK